MIDHYLQNYPDFLRYFCNDSEGTIRDYQHDLNTYIDFFKETVDPTLATFTINPVYIRNFVKYLRKRKNSSVTVERRLHGVYSFWHYLHFDHGFSTPVSIKYCGIKLKKKRKLTRPLSTEEYKKLMETTYEELRDFE